MKERFTRKKIKKNNERKNDPNIMKTLNEYAAGHRHLITIGRILEAVSRVEYIMNTQPLESNGNAQPKDNSVVLENVSYRYEDAAKDAVHNVSISIGSGEHIALIGPSGGGKTTVSRLATHFWDATGGKITLGGMDISKADPEALLSAYSIVFQDVTLSNQSIMDNIRIGRKGASFRASLLRCSAHTTEATENGCAFWLTGQRRQVQILLTKDLQ